MSLEILFSENILGLSSLKTQEMFGEGKLHLTYLYNALQLELPHLYQSPSSLKMMVS